MVLDGLSIHKYIHTAGFQYKSLHIEADLLGGLVVGVPPMRPIWPQPRLDARGRLAVAVGYEVVRVSPCHCVVCLEVIVRHHMMIIPLEQSHLHTDRGRLVHAPCNSTSA